MSRIAISIALLVLQTLCFAQVQFTEFNVSNAPSGYPMVPQRLTVGADGNIWFTEYQPNNWEDRVGRITTNGVITEFRATLGPNGWVGPKMWFGITSLNGKLWYVAANGKIGRMDPLSPYPIGPYDEFVSHAHPYTGMDMITGPDGNVWYTQYASIGKMSAAGVNAGSWSVNEFIGGTNQPNRICVGPDGNLWVTVGWGGVVRMTPAGVLLGSYSATPFATERGVTTGADGRVWFADTGRIAAVNMSGTVASYPVGSGRGVEWVTTGPDGNLWATAGDFFGRGLLRMNTAGVPTFYYLSNPPSNSWTLNDIITGPDGCLWLAAGSSGPGKIIRACLPGPRPVNITSPNPDGVYVTGNTITITVGFDTPVIVSGNPSLALNSGGTATYASGSGTNVLTFTYTVQAGETTNRLDAHGAVPNLLSNLPGRAMSIKLNGGTIRDASGNNAILLAPVSAASGSLPSNKALAINPPVASAEIMALQPSAGGNAGTLSMRIYGSGFLPGATVKLVRTGLPDILASPVTVDFSGAAISLVFDLRGAAIGSRDVVVTNPGGASAVRASAFTVENARDSDIWVDIVGRERTRAGTTETVFILYGNRGNNDAVGVPLMIGGIPYDATWGLASALTPPPSYPGVQPTDWSQLPTRYVSGTQLVLPLLLSKVPPGTTGFLILGLSIPTARSFNLRTWAGTPYFDFLNSRFIGSPCHVSIGQTLANGFFTSVETKTSSLLHYNEQVKNIIVANCGTSALPLSATHDLYQAADYLMNTGSGGINSRKGSRNLLGLIAPSGGLPQYQMDGCCIYNELKSYGERPSLLPALGDLLACPAIATSIGCTPPEDPGDQVITYCFQRDSSGKLLPWRSGGGEEICVPAPDKDRGFLVGTAWDPNDKTGATGHGVPRYISGEEPLRYTVFFENVPGASLPAQRVTITDQLDLSKFDVATFSLGSIVVGDKQVVPPPGLSQFSSGIDLRPAKNLLVRINASLNPSSGLITWSFTSEDPATGQPIADPLEGFLPPNSSPPAGEGHVLFSVKPKPALATGIDIRNSARIVFDANPPIDTPQWLNTIDNAKPSSQVLPLSSPQNSPSFTVQWSGSDQGSGVETYTIYVSENGGPFTAMLRDTTATSGTFTGEAGKSYAFFSVARDFVGNVEGPKTAGEASTLINADGIAPATTLAQTPPPNANGWNRTEVTVHLSAADNSGGSGVKEITYSAVGAQVIGPTTVNGSTASVSLIVEGVTTITYFAKDNSGNTEAAKTLTIRIDKTPPAATASASPGANANGWHRTDVIVSFTCTDAGSGLAPGSPPAATTLSSDGAGQSASGACQDLAGNSVSVSVTEINIDKTKPTASATRTPAANAAGWNNTNVTVSFAGSDSLSGIASCTPDVTLGEGAGQSASGTCTDRAGNISDPAVAAGINIDKTAPSISSSRSPAPNAAGWNNTNVTVTFVCSDPLSGPSPGGAVTLSAEGANQSASGSCTDQAGNSVSATVSGVSIDKTAPSVAASPAPGPVWYNSAVTVGFAGVDALSGITGCTAPVTLAADGAGQSANGACTDQAGNVGVLAAAPYNIDSAKPVISQVTADPAAVPVNSGFTLRVTVSDAASGVASVQYSVNGGAYSSMTAGAGVWSASVAALPVGVYDACSKATDQAGNESATVCALVAVYDPSGSFVTGAGSIVSPAGAFAANPALTGRANFAFTSKYHNGATTPSGETQFKFQLANLSFKSAAYDWLVVAGARAQFKGTGTINNSGDYGFLLTAIDGAVPGGGGVDKFRIKIWARNPDGGAGGVVYDNQMGADDTGNSATAIENGSIVIHK